MTSKKTAARNGPTLQSLRRSLKAVAKPQRVRHNLRFFKTSVGEYGAGDRFLGLTVPPRGRPQARGSDSTSRQGRRYSMVYPFLIETGKADQLFPSQQHNPVRVAVDTSLKCAKISMSVPAVGEALKPAQCRKGQAEESTLIHY